MTRRTARTVVLAGLLALPATAVAATDAELLASAEQLRRDWPRAWGAAWSELVIAAIAIVLYAVRASRLGPRLPRWRAACFAAGVLVLLFSTGSPLDPLGEEGLFAFHMLQHMLLGDLAALLLVLGVTGPVLQPVLKYRWVQWFRRLTHPLVAFILWAVLLIGWHIPVMYEAALSNSWIHGLEHISFLTAGVVMWAPIMESLPAPEWFGSGAKLLYLTAVRAVDAVVANVFLWSGSVFYDRYEVTAPVWGLSPLADQGYAGMVMMTWTGVATIAVSTILFFRMAREGELRQELIDRGLDPVAVRRAVRYGRGEALARRHGIDIGGAGGEAGRR